MDQLADLIEAGSRRECVAWLDHSDSRDTVYNLSRLTEAQRERLLELLEPEVAAGVLDQLPEAQAVDAIEGLESGIAARILEELPSDEQADLIGELEAEDAEAILEALDPSEAAEVRQLTAYDEFEAGGLMKLEFVAFRPDSTVQDVLDALERGAERYARIDVQYAYVVGYEGELLGVVPVRALLLAPRSRWLGEIMVPDPVSVSDHTPFDELSQRFEDHTFLGLPVVNEVGRLMGVIERGSVERARVEDAEARYRHTQGIVGGEELRSMPLHTRSGRRLAWLTLNIALNILAASIIAFHQETIEAVIALAVFLPIISDMSGCSGSQAVAVSMRELTLGVARPRDLLIVLRKELSVGLVNGVALGILIGLVAFAWKGNPYLGAVVGSALALNTMVAVSIGGSIPLVLKGLDLDPALASGPVLTTITDMCGFVLVLSLAASAIGHLQGL